MKNRFLFLLLCAAFFAACTKDLTETGSASGKDDGNGGVIVNSPEGAIAGTLTVRVSPEVADRIESSVTRSGGTRSGIDNIDAIFDQIGTESFFRVFPYEERFEARHRAAGLHLWYGISFDEAADLQQAAQSLSRDPNVELVRYNYPVKRPEPQPVTAAVTETAPVTYQTRALPANDPKLSDQWHYDNPGGIRGGSFTSKAGADINLFDAWELCTGDENITVAVIDAPVQYSHPDLAANMWTNPDAGEVAKGLEHGANFCVNENSDPLPINWSGHDVDDYGNPVHQDHGSHVAGTIAAVNGNGIGVCGIAGGKNGQGGVKIMSCQMFSSADGQKGNYPYASSRAFVWAADRGAVIAQNSWGGGSPSTLERWSNGPDKAAIDYFIDNAGNAEDFPDSPLRGGLVIFAAGNSGAEYGTAQFFPAAYPATVAVAAMSFDYTPAYYTEYGDWVDITAPGGDASYGKEGQIWSTVLDPNTCGIKLLDGRSEGYDAYQGTSMACPHVSGIAALGLSYARQLGKSFTAEEFKNMLLASTNNINKYMVGTKNGALGMMRLSSYWGNMGVGYVDASKLLLAIKGTPSVYVKSGEKVSIDLGKYFGGSYTEYSYEVSVKDTAKSKLGMVFTNPVDGVWTLTCKNQGAALVTIKCNVGGAEMQREFAVISRDGASSNGGWL